MQSFKSLTEGFDIPISTHADVDKAKVNNPEDIKKLLDYLHSLQITDIPLAGGSGPNGGAVKIRGTGKQDRYVELITKFVKDNTSLSIGSVSSSSKSMDILWGEGQLAKGGIKKPSGADWENILTYKFNEMSGNPEFDVDAKTAALEFSDVYLEMGEILAKQFKDKIGSSPITQYGKGKSKSNLSKFWLENGGSDGTPKTDMYNADYNISLKKAGGSQLASGAKGETVSTYLAALQYMGTNGVTPELNKILKSIEEGFAKVSTKYGKTDLEKMADKQGELSPEDKKAVGEFLTTDKFHKDLNNEIAQHLTFEKQPEFLKWYTYEAMSGYKKFSNKQAAASVCLEFDGAKGKVSKFIEVTSGGKNTGLTDSPSVSSDVIKIAGKVKVYASWKSASGNPYSVLRLGLTEDNKTWDTTKTLAGIIREEVIGDKIATMLNEDIYQLDEFAIIRRTISKLKKMGKDAIVWFKGLMDKIMSKVRESLKKIVALGARMYEKLFEFLGMVIDKIKASYPSEIVGFI